MARRTSVPSTTGGPASGASPRTGGSVVTTRSIPRCLLRGTAIRPAPLFGDAENPDDLRHGRADHVGYLLLGPAGDRVRHRHVLEFREAHDLRHRPGGRPEGVWADAEGGDAAPLQHDPSGKSARAARASIADPGDGEVGIAQDLLD